MKTALQTFLEAAGDKIKNVDCQIMERIRELLELEKQCVAGAYEAGLIAGSKDLKIDAVDYYNRFYSEDENSNARIDMQLGPDTGQIKKRKRKRIS